MTGSSFIEAVRRGERDLHGQLAVPDFGVGPGLRFAALVATAVRHIADAFLRLRISQPVDFIQEAKDLARRAHVATVGSFTGDG